jgi:hypothetical protein
VTLVGKGNRDAVEIGVRLPEHLAGGRRHADGGAEFAFAFPLRRDEDSLLDAVERQAPSGVEWESPKPSVRQTSLPVLALSPIEPNLGSHRRHDEHLPDLHDALRPAPLGRFGPVLLLDRDDPVGLVRLAIDPEDLAEAADEIDRILLDERHPAAAGERELARKVVGKAPLSPQPSSRDRQRRTSLVSSRRSRRKTSPPAMAAPPNPSFSFFSHFTGGASAFQPESLRPVSAERPSRPGPWNCGQSAAVAIPARASREKRGRIRFIGGEGAKARRP